MTTDNHDITELLGSARSSIDTDACMAMLRARLTAEAEAAGVLDVAYRALNTPVGTLLRAAIPAGLVRVAFEREGIDAVRERKEHFAGRRHRPKLPLVLRFSLNCRRTVLTHLLAIAYRHTARYRAVAAAVHTQMPYAPSARRARRVRSRSSSLAAGSSDPMARPVPTSVTPRSSGSSS